MLITIILKIERLIIIVKKMKSKTLFEKSITLMAEWMGKIRDIPISEIDEFPDHPFKVLMDEDMEQLVESIKRNGVMTPATVHLKEDGRYELISGHRRKKACELAGLETLKYLTCTIYILTSIP